MYKKKFIVMDTEERRNTMDALITENADLLLKNAMQDVTIQALQDENSEIIFKIAQMEVEV